MNSSNPETAEHNWFPFLRYKKEFEAAGKEVSVNEWMRASGQLDAKRAIEKEALEKKGLLKVDKMMTKNPPRNESWIK